MSKVMCPKCNKTEAVCFVKGSSNDLYPRCKRCADDWGGAPRLQLVYPPEIKPEPTRDDLEERIRDEWSRENKEHYEARNGVPLCYLVEVLKRVQKLEEARDG